MTHSSLQLNHKLENWTYANAAARTGATGFTSGDIGKVCYQTDTGMYYRLTAITPTWQVIAPASSIDIQFFTANGTWTKPANARLTFVICIGAGAGGGGGRRGAAASARTGGGGGGPGGWLDVFFLSSLLGATETIIVGAGGTGGAARTTDNGANIGVAGGNSSFGSWITARGGTAGPAGTASSSGSAASTPSM